jgi:hypothetical protein
MASTTASEAMGGRLFPRLHWSAVIAGVFLAIAAHIVLGLIGAALGFAAEPADSEALGAGAAIWALITPFVASLLGAWLAVRLSGNDRAVAGERAGGYVHGVLVWAIGLIAGAIFLTGTLATGAMTAGTAASGNLGSAQRMVGGDVDRPAGPEAEARADDAGRAGAAATGGAALAAIAGLLGAVVGCGLAMRRGEGRGLGWKIAIQRDERRREAMRAGEARAYASETGYGAGTEGRIVTPAAGEARPESTDPYHH